MESNYLIFIQPFTDITNNHGYQFFRRCKEIIFDINKLKFTYDFSALAANPVFNV